MQFSDNGRLCQKLQPAAAAALRGGLSQWQLQGPGPWANCSRHVLWVMLKIRQGMVTGQLNA